VKRGRKFIGRILLAYALVLVFGFFGPGPAFGEEGERIDPEAFERLVQEFRDPTKLANFEGIQHKNLNLHYVFITGFGGEIAPAIYYYSQVRQLRQMGVPASHIHIIKPQSSRSIDENADLLKASLERIPGKLIIVGHSKGGAEALVFAAKNPEFFDQKVQGMYLFQVPNRGSFLADQVMARRPVDFSQQPFWDRFMLNADIWKAKLIYKPFFREGLESLTTKRSEERWAEINEKYGASAAIVKPKTHFITSVTDSPDALSRIMDRLVGPNDGIVPLYSQSLPEWGNVIAEIKAHHVGLVVLTPASLWQDRRAVMGAIAVTVESEGSPQPKCPWKALAR
jgi:hypothetical protein